MPTQVQGLGLVDDQGNKSIVVNLSNARQMTNAEYQQLSQSQRTGAIIVTDYPIPEESDSVSVTADGTKTFRELLNELYTLIDYDKVNDNTVLMIGSSISHISNKTSNNGYLFGGGGANGANGAHIRASSSLFTSYNYEYSNFTDTSTVPCPKGEKIAVVYNYYTNQDIHTEYLASNCMMSDGETNAEEAIDELNEKVDNKTDKGIIIYKKFSASYVGAASYSADLSNAQCVMITYRKSDGTDSLYTVVVPIGVTVKLYTGESREFYRSFTTSTTGVSWTASSDPDYPNAFVLPQFVIAF